MFPTKRNSLQKTFVDRQKIVRYTKSLYIYVKKN